MPLLTACAGGNFDTKKSTNLVLPPIVQFSSKVRESAAREIGGGQCEGLTEIARSYKATRDKLRIARKELET